MDDPIKIIHKYKNNNGRIQYHIHIFLGDIVDDTCMRVLKKISDMDMYTALTSLEERDRNIITKNYGEYWYEKFYNSYHINNTKDLTAKNQPRAKELRSIYGTKWFNTHFINYQKRIETITYNYESVIREERERKNIKRMMQRQQYEAEDIVDYTTLGKSKNSTLSTSNSGLELNNNENDDSDDSDDSNSEKIGIDTDTNQTPNSNIKSINNIRKNKVPKKKNNDWCSDESSSADEDGIESDYEFSSESESESGQEIEELDTDEEIDDYYDRKHQDRNGYQDQSAGIGLNQNNDDESDAEFDDPANGEFDFENMEEDAQLQQFEKEIDNDLESADIYFEDIDETDKNVKLTTKEIKEAISNEMYEKLNKKVVEFNTSKDNNMFDENLKDVYSKNYITHQYIYKDDTIKNIHNKICCGFKNNVKFSDDAYIIPSYQYIWSEYHFQNNIEKIMIGQKWIVKNDILKLDVEPNPNLAAYEDLRGNLKILRDNIKRQGKIKREDDDNNILLDYEGFYTYNELYMIDIYNELGLGYDPNVEELRNILDVYLKIYFPKIRVDDIKNILDILNKNESENKKNSENNKLKMIFDTITNDLILENVIMRDIEVVKKKNIKDYSKIFKENFVTQSVIRAYLLNRYEKINLFRIFDNFMLDMDYPFIQFQPTDGTPRYRFVDEYLMKNEKKEIIMKWFENSPYGISFKVKVNDKSDYKYMAINLSDNGRIDYKIQWKEEDMSTVDDIANTYHYIQKLVKKINIENQKFNIVLNMPENDDFRFAFINSIQKFELPEKFTINHDDFSEFSRYFFPYVALVIEPRKRKSKTIRDDKDEKSKFGTYLRYKRVSKYENKTKIEHRIIFFMRNYEYNDQSLANEISKEFNITEEQAISEIENIRDKYPNIKKSRKVLKKLENIPKYKPPGIGVDIQGKNRNKYKMRIAGARDREQLERIILFMNILIYLYVETYLYKKPERQKILKVLEGLNKIARRRNKVDEIVKYDSPIKTVKQMTSIDKKRLSYKAEEDQNQWTRNCQNSGDDKRRRPQQFLNIEELIKLGYVWKETMGDFSFGHYERTVMTDPNGNTTSGKKKKNVSLRAVKLPLDDSGENFVYYTCSPEENGKHMYIGFLNKSKNPYGEAMPCCFIKDHFYSKNKEKRNFFLKSIGILQKEEDNENKISGDQLYILQNSNKIQEGRFAFLPKYLDIFMNYMTNNDRIIKNHYLISTTTGYYFKYGTKYDDHKFLNSICTIFDMTIEGLKSKLIKTLEADKNLTLFTSLNNGEIRSQFGKIEAYISYIKHNEYLEYPLLNDLLSLPGIIRKHGVNILIFQKKIRIIRKSLEREKVKESYYIICQNNENTNNFKNPKRESAFIIKESKNYYPIVMVKKEDDINKDIILTKTFFYEDFDKKNDDTKKNIVRHMIEYERLNCQSELQILTKNKSVVTHNAKETVKILSEIEGKQYQPKIQIIDAKYKCKFIVTYGGYIIPCNPSGTIYNVGSISMSHNIDNYIKDYNTTYAYLIDIYELSNHKLSLKPIGIYYKEKKEKSYVISAIMTQSYDSVPIVERYMTMEYIKKENMIILNKPNDESIDKEIMKGVNNYVIDNRIYEVSKNKYNIELYQLFRLHLSYFLDKVPSGIKYKSQLEDLITDNKLTKDSKNKKIKALLYRMMSTDLEKTFNQLVKKILPLPEQNRINKNSNSSKKNNYLSEAITPINIKYQKDKSVEIIPRDFNTRDKRPRSNLRNLAETPDFAEFNNTESIPIATPPEFIKNEAPNLKPIHFPPEEKHWIHILPKSKKIDYPAFILKNNRELCYNNSNKDSCNVHQHCNWNNSKNLCMLSIKEDMAIDYVNKISEELIQNGLKAQEILKKNDYFVSDIVNYNVFTERPGERIIMSSNTNLDKILTEIFGKIGLPRIGKRRSRLDIMQNYEQLQINNPLKEINSWYIQNIIENNNSIFRAFANAYYWLTHPYNDITLRNLGYYSIQQTSLSNFYKSIVVDWLLKDENQDSIKKILPYVKYGKVKDFATKLISDVQTLTNCLVELFVLSKYRECIIYVNDENNNIIYAFHPSQGIIYDYNKVKNEFNIGKYHSYKKILNIRFIYTSKNIFPNKIEVMYPKIKS